LERQGFNVFLPLCWERGDPTPLFPRYLFVWGKNWGPINNTFGVCYLLMRDNKPAVLPESVIDEIKSRMVNGVVQLSAPSKRNFLRGQRLKVVAGGYAGLSGLFVRRSKDRIVALLNMFGGKILATVPESNIA